MIEFRITVLAATNIVITLPLAPVLLANVELMICTSIPVKFPPLDALADKYKQELPLSEVLLWNKLFTGAVIPDDATFKVNIRD